MPSVFSLRSFAFALFCALVDPTAYARWAPHADAPSTRTLARVEYVVRKDGTHVQTLEQAVRINLETARSSEGTVTISYNRQAEKFTLLGAEVRTAQGVIPVESQHVEDVATSSEAQGFDAQNQVTIAFPQAEVGSVLYLRYRVETTEVPFAGHFHHFQSWGTDHGLDEDFELTIRSEIPLRLALNDPLQALKVAETRDGAMQVIKAKQTRPLYFSVIDEGEESFQPLRLFTGLMVSSLKSHDELVQSVAADYDKVLSSPLPAELEAVAKAAEAQKGFVARANAVVAGTADLVRYMGDWRPTRGSFIPRPLATIASTRFGDCKDFSAVVASILRRLGYAANVAWIDRAETPSELALLPSPEFNHAIVRVEVDGKTYWLDGTNTATFADHVAEDLTDRDALVIDGKAPRLERVRLPAPEENVTDVKTVLKVEATGDAEAVHQVRLSGLAAEPIVSSTKVTSKDSYDNELVKWLADGRFVKWSRVGAYDRTSRVVGDMSFEVSMGLRQAAIFTTTGMAYRIGSDDMAFLLRLDPEKTVSDIFISQPRTWRQRVTLPRTRMVGAPPPDCRVDTPWYTVTRRVVPGRDDIVIEEQTIYRKPRLANAELKSEAFRRAQAETAKCLREFAVIFDVMPPVSH